MPRLAAFEFMSGGRKMQAPRKRRLSGFLLLLTGGLVTVSGGPVAHGSVAVDTDRIVVTDGEGGRAVVERAPFRLFFEDDDGNVVLQQVGQPLVPGATANPLDPELAGIDAIPETAVYAPFQFEVGAERNTQNHVIFWTGNMQTGTYGGVVHHATEVTDVVLEGEGVRLTVATTDPARALSVRIRPDEGSSVRVIARPVPDVGVSAMGDSFVSGPDEAFHGFGGRHNRIDQRGHDFYSWIEEENFDAGPLQPVADLFPGGGGDRYLFPNGQHAAYYVQNLFISSRDYGFFLNETEITRWRLAVDSEDTWQVRVRGASLDYTVAIGDSPTAIEAITAINGRHRIPADWALGPMVKRNVQQGEDEPPDQREKIQADLDAIERYMNDDTLEPPFTMSGYVYESWDSLWEDPQDPDDWVRTTNRRIHDLGMCSVGYVRAYANDDGNFDRDGTFEDALVRDLFTKHPGGFTPYLGVAVGPAGLYDFTNPATVEWWEWRKIRLMLALGFDGFMQDFGEQTTDDMWFENGDTGVEMHNEYPNVFHAATRKMLDEWQAEDPGRAPHCDGDVWMYTRAGFSGRPGSAAFESGNFPGDEQTDWTQANGIAALARDMLNRAVGGAYGYSTDIGGYYSAYAADSLDEELFVRWTQWAALSPYFRLHNNCCSENELSEFGGTKMPWHWYDGDPNTFDGFVNWNRMAALRERALPLIKTLWHEAVDTGMPITRPMWLAFPNDSEAAKQDQQWMLGESVLVAPVVTKGATSREVYFPAGCWEDGATGAIVHDDGVGASVNVPAPLEKLPWFRKCGTDPIPTAAP